MTTFAITLGLAAAVFALASLGLAAGLVAGRGPLRRRCRPEACDACARPCPRRAARAGASAAPEESPR